MFYTSPIRISPPIWQWYNTVLAVFYTIHGCPRLLFKFASSSTGLLTWLLHISALCRCNALQRTAKTLPAVPLQCACDTPREVPLPYAAPLLQHHWRPLHTVHCTLAHCTTVPWPLHISILHTANRPQQTQLLFKPVSACLLQNSSLMWLSLLLLTVGPSGWCCGDN